MGLACVDRFRPVQTDIPWYTHAGSVPVSPDSKTVRRFGKRDRNSEHRLRTSNSQTLHNLTLPPPPVSFLPPFPIYSLISSFSPLSYQWWSVIESSMALCMQQRQGYSRDCPFPQSPWTLPALSPPLTLSRESHQNTLLHFCGNLHTERARTHTHTHT